MVISKHAYIRSNERNGLGRKATERMVEKVWTLGIPAEETTGSVKQWSETILKNSGSSGRPLDSLMFYGDKAYLFNEGVLITILQMPSGCMKTMNGIRRKVKYKPTFSNGYDVTKVVC